MTTLEVIFNGISLVLIFLTFVGVLTSCFLFAQAFLLLKIEKHKLTLEFLQALPPPELTPWTGQEQAQLDWRAASARFKANALFD